jgi:RNA polymerase sigma-70 factor (ECF subfamily)
VRRVSGAGVDLQAEALASSGDLRLVERLRAGDEDAFVEAVRLYGGPMLRVARLFVSTRAVAEEVVQEAWLGVIAGIDRFEGRSSFKTWLFRILTNTAKTRGEREGRTVPFSSLAPAELAGDEPSVEPERFLPDGARWAHYWASAPRRFDELPEGKLLSNETLAVAQAAIDRLPSVQRAVMTMRDVAGFEPEEVCDALGLSEGNQRVLLHRARAKVRGALERYFDEGANG